MYTQDLFYNHHQDFWIKTSSSFGLFWIGLLGLDFLGLDHWDWTFFRNGLLWNTIFGLDFLWDLEFWTQVWLTGSLDSEDLYYGSLDNFHGFFFLSFLFSTARSTGGGVGTPVCCISTTVVILLLPTCS